MKTLKELEAYAAARGMVIVITKQQKVNHKKIILNVDRKGN